MLASSFGLLILGIIAALRQNFHLSNCLNLPGHLFPQTAQEAQSYGWAWLTVKCQGCRHSRDIKLDEILRRAKDARLGTFAGKLYCGKCRGRALEFSLGMYDMSNGQPWAQRRPVAFNGSSTVRAPRE